MRLISTTAAALAMLLLASCGGGGGCDAGTSPITGATGCATTTGPTTAPKAERLVIQLNKATASNTGADTVVATATATAAGGQTLAGVPITLAVDANALYTASAATTNAQGVVTATVSVGSDRSNRVVTVTATSGALTATASFQVTGSKLLATALPAVVLPSSTANRVSFRLTDANDNPIAEQAISVTAGAVGSATGVTGANGEFIYTYTAPATAGTLRVEASSGGVTAAQDVLVQGASSSFPNVTVPVLSASVSANPLVVSTNNSGSTNQLQVRALFLSASNAPIQYVRVRFDNEPNTNSIPGTFSTTPNLIYSDANGVATASYIPGSRSSPTNGVNIRACYDKVDFPVGTCPNSTTATVTVVAEPLAITIGTDEKIADGPSGLTYIANFVVLVVDASGKAKANVAIEPSIDIQTYIKGEYVRGTNPAKWGRRPPGGFACPNEDLNRNGVLEAAEDVNQSGSIEPRKSDIAISVVGSASTDATGIVKLQVEYPKNIASWAIFRITVGAGVSGTEGRATWTEQLRVPESAINAEPAPAFIESPYGIYDFDISVRPADAVSSLPYVLDRFNAAQTTYPNGVSLPAAGTVLTPCRNPY